MILHQRPPASRPAYSHVIREQLLARDGKALPQRMVDDRDAGRGSLRLVSPPRSVPTAQAPPAAYPPSPDDEDIPF